jgi:polysaccharide export outer membrane protein
VTRPSAIVLAAGLLAGCADLGQYVDVKDLPETPQAPVGQGYVISPGDLIAVRVYNQDGMSARGRVRADGKISLPLLNDVDAAGYTPTALAQQLQTRLKEYIHLPVVTVSLEELRPIPVSMLGEIAKPGLYQLDPASTGILQALAMAGGLTDFAHRDRIFVIRQTPQKVRIRFLYRDLVQADTRAALFRLQTGDVLVVQ